MERLCFVTTACICFSLLSCSKNSATESLATPDTALKPGMMIAAKNSTGAIAVAYAGPTIRDFYTSKSDYRRVEMKVRPKPLDGRSGLYNPATTSGVPNEPRFVVADETINHYSTHHIYNRLSSGKNYFDWVWNSDGIVVGYGADPSRYQVNIRVYKILLHNKPASEIERSCNECIKIAHSKEEWPEILDWAFADSG